jgi:hypothetical protein
MYARVKKRLKKSWDIRREYIVHVVAHESFDLIAQIEKYTPQYTVIETPQRHAHQSVKVRLRPSQLRRMQQELPGEVLFSYELVTKPGTQ